MRLFEIPATKSLQIADKCPQDWFKDGDEIVLYKNNQDLLQKINYFIDNDEERERIRRLLEESGAESSRIMEYLFEEPGEREGAETPW